MDANQNKKTGIIVAIIIMVFILFMSFWGFDLINQRMQAISNESSDIEQKQINQDQINLIASNYATYETSTRITDEYGFYPEVVPTYGNPNAPITVIEFTNFYCAFCEMYHKQDFAKLLEKYQDSIYYASIFVFSDAYNNMDLTVATACSAMQGKNEYVEYAFSLKSHKFTEDDLFEQADHLNLDIEKFTSCYNDTTIRDLLDQNESVARDLGVYSTPFFLIDGQMLIGASYDYMDSTIAQLLGK